MGLRLGIELGSEDGRGFDGGKRETQRDGRKCLRKRSNRTREDRRRDGVLNRNSGLICEEACRAPYICSAHWKVGKRCGMTTWAWGTGGSAER